MYSVHGKLKGKKWSVWTEELGPGSPPGDTGRDAGSSTPPTPPVPIQSEDVMKLPKEEMHTYGQCPNWDRFVLVTCEKCKRKVKLEAIESHITLRHGSKSERNAYHKILAAKASTALRTCQVKLTRYGGAGASQAGALGLGASEGDDPKICDTPGLISGSSGSTSPTPTSHPSTPPHMRGSTPSPFPTPTPPLSTQASIVHADSASAPETRSPTPDESCSRPGDDQGDLVEDMDIDFIDQIPGADEEMTAIDEKPSEQQRRVITPGPPVLEAAPIIAATPPPSQATKVVDTVELAEEADSTTNNVISIPDTDDISNIEIDIISEGHVNTKYNVSLMKPELSLEQQSTRPISGVPLPAKHDTPSAPSSARPSTLISPPVATSAASNTLTPTRTTFHLSPAPKTPLLQQQSTPTKPISLPSRPLPQVFLPQGSVSNAPSAQQHHLQQQIASPKLPQHLDSSSSNSSSSETITMQLPTAPVAPPTTHYINVSPFSKSSPKKPVLLKAALDKRPTGREREYDPNKHCGVWDADGKRNCTRSLTCKSHSVYLKRKVANRSGPFDQLLAAHKAEKEALNKAMEIQERSNNEPTINTINQANTTASSILARRLQPNFLPGGIQKVWDPTKELNKVNSSSLLKPNTAKHVMVNQNIVTKDNYCDENLDYSVDHPKPLAVCTYGGKRIGGFFITDRSKFLSRKVMKIAISSVGLQRIQSGLQQQQHLQGNNSHNAATTTTTMTGIPGVKRISGLVSVPVTSRQQSLPYLLNVGGGGSIGTLTGGTVTSLPGGVGTIQRVTGSVGGGLNGSPRLGATLQLGGGGGGGVVVGAGSGGGGGGAITVGPAAPHHQSQHFVVQDAFKTDIQDFKGGIKFELGRNIHHVISTQDPGLGSG